ncbi:MAG: universal stress protein [Chloroflexota bacterium]
MYNRILVPLDGSKLAESSLEHVKAIATGCQVAEVILLAVVSGYRPGAGFSWGGVESEKQMAGMAEKAQAKARSYLDSVGAKLAEKGMVVRTCVMIGSPAETILNYVKDNNIDLIVIATHGRSGLSRWALGSVAEKVLTASPVPVFIVSPKKR